MTPHWLFRLQASWPFCAGNEDNCAGTVQFALQRLFASVPNTPPPVAAIGVLIANRSTCRLGLAAGIGLSLVYMASAAILTPVLWIEPLGALIKTGPAIVLMLVGLAILRDR